jgi:hypothetical protein
VGGVGVVVAGTWAKIGKNKDNNNIVSSKRYQKDIAKRGNYKN